MAWHLAELQLKIVGKGANSVGRLVEFGGDVLDFWWGVLLVSGPPTLRPLGIVGLERVVAVLLCGGPILLLLDSLLGLLLQLTSLLRRCLRLESLQSIHGIHLGKVPVRLACCSRTCNKKKSSEFLHTKIISKRRCRLLFICRNSNG